MKSADIPINVISVLYLSPIDRDTTHKYRQSALLGYPIYESHLNSCWESMHIGTFPYVLASVGVIMTDPGGIKIRSHGSKAIALYAYMHPDERHI